MSAGAGIVCCVSVVSFYYDFRHSEPQSYRKSHEKAPDMTENRMPGVQVLNYLKSFALFFAFERDWLANRAQIVWGDAEERGEVL